ncbi:ATP-binding protein [Streptomyces thermoalcalitolerans]|uniref:Histidine kinase/HSP90-like ATPase domain-containing protein n=1 Tax=Streptomyces thermoalcalitolerans TaxID=65605 RepID=A0ABP3ZEY2_9ACTN
MSMLVHWFVLTGTEKEVPQVRREIVDKVRAWGVPLDEGTTDAIRLVASELIANAVVHGKGPITVGLRYRPGRLAIDVLDGDPSVPRTGRVRADDESGRGLALVGLLAACCAWKPVGSGKRVWAEIELPMVVPVTRAAVPCGLSAKWAEQQVVTKPKAPALAVA